MDKYFRFIYFGWLVATFHAYGRFWKPYGGRLVCLQLAEFRGSRHLDVVPHISRSEENLEYPIRHRQGLQRIETFVFDYEKAIKGSEASLPDETVNFGARA